MELKVGQVFDSKSPYGGDIFNSEVHVVAVSDKDVSLRWGTVVSPYVLVLRQPKPKFALGQVVARIDTGAHYVVENVVTSASERFIYDLKDAHYRTAQFEDNLRALTAAEIGPRT